jgi:regulator of sigma E protease
VSLIIFIIILSALVIVHELGHFLVARKFGIRVDEFGLGFPPRAKKLFTWKDTPFTLNWLPFGGFVKIFGENPSDNLETKFPSEFGNLVSKTDSFQSKNRGVQTAVLVAGVVGNFIFAWFLISLGFVIGLAVPENFSIPIENPQTVITLVLPESPAAFAGLQSGDTIISVSRDGISSVLIPEEISSFIIDSPEPIIFEIERGKEIFRKIILPEEGIVLDRLAIGISMDVMGIAKLAPLQALWHGLKVTSELTLLTARAIGTFILQAFGGRADLSSVTGPVGIVSIVGDARELGFTYLLTLTALISVNLSIINLLPFPALDGGRLLFVIIEAVTRRPIAPRVFNTLNTLGFAFLIFLMLLITIRDVRNIF